MVGYGWLWKIKPNYAPPKRNGVFAEMHSLDVSCRASESHLRVLEKLGNQCLYTSFRSRTR